MQLKNQSPIPIALILLILIVTGLPLRAEEDIDKASRTSVDEILQSYVNDFKFDRHASNAISFGIHVPGCGMWCVRVKGESTGESWSVNLSRGAPASPTFVYRIEEETLYAIHSGKINALTAQGKASAGDYTPMSVTQMDGYQPTLAEIGEINPLSFHFWTRGFPETIPFRSNLTRSAHGSNFGVFYYEPGLRTGWYSVKPGEKVHAGPEERPVPFSILAIATQGTTEAEIDGARVSLSEGNAVFIPANAKHHWWNESDAPSEAILVMFGDGA